MVIIEIKIKMLGHPPRRKRENIYQSAKRDLDNIMQSKLNFSLSPSNSSSRAIRSPVRRSLAFRKSLERIRSSNQ